MKTNPFLTTDHTDCTDELPAFSYPCYPCHPSHPWLKFFLLHFTFCLCFACCGHSAFAQVQQAWVARYNNGIATGTNHAVKMALDSLGDIYITGFSENTNGNLDYVTVKYASNGNQVWASHLDPTNTTYGIPTAIALDSSNNVIVTGYAVTVKYDANGNVLWTSTSNGTALAVDAGGNVYVTGFGTNFNTEKLSPNGSNVWGRTYVDAGPMLAQFILVDKQANMYVGGSDTYADLFHGGVIYGYAYQLTVAKYDANGNKLWNASYTIDGENSPQVVGAALDGVNNVYVLATIYNYPFQTTMFSNNGVVGWSSESPSPIVTQPHGLAVEQNGNVFVTGQVPYAFNGAYSYYYGTFKLSTNGSSVWSDYFPQPPSGSSVATAITVDQANNVYVTGYSSGTNSGNDIVTIKYDNNGNQLWVQRYNGPGNGDDEGNAIAVDASGNVFVTGYETTTAGGTEMVTIKYAPGAGGGVKQANGGFLLQVQGEPQEAFDIQASTNFTNWLDLGVTTADTNGNLQFLDTNAAQYPQRFYTAKPQ